MSVKLEFRSYTFALLKLWLTLTDIGATDPKTAVKKAYIVFHGKQIYRNTRNSSVVRFIVV